jgi:hypothetical protein
MFVFRFASSCGFCGGGGVVVLLAWLALLALLAFLRFETSTDGSSHSSPPWPITSGTALANDTERPRWRVPFFSPPGPGLFAAELFRISLAPGHRCARAMSMRGLLEFAAEAAAALSVEGFRKSLTSESICCLLAFGSRGVVFGEDLGPPFAALGHHSRRRLVCSFPRVHHDECRMLERVLWSKAFGLAQRGSDGW